MAALSVDGPLGVDIERHRAVEQSGGIARRHFTDAERDRKPAAAERFADWFFAHWTAKEAVVKLLGTGLSTPLQQIETPDLADPLSGGWAVLPSENPLRLERCWVTRLPAPAGYAAAIATPLPASTVVCRSLADG